MSDFYPDPVFKIGKFKGHLENMVVGLDMMQGEVRISGHKVETRHIQDIGDHLYNHLPADQRIWGATLTQITRCFELNPWNPRDLS